MKSILRKSFSQATSLFRFGSAMSRVCMPIFLTKLFFSFSTRVSKYWAPKSSLKYLHATPVFGVN